MIIIGEKLNSSIPKTLDAIQAGDEEYVIRLIKQQTDTGADYLDLNTAICGAEEEEKMLWLLELVLKHSTCGIMVDSPSPSVIQSAVEACGNRPVIINSVTIEDRYESVLPIVLKYHTGIVALPIDQDGIPETLADRITKTDLLIHKLRQSGVPDPQIYIDVLVETLATNTQSALNALGTIRHIAQHYPEINTTCGLSNVSFGLPKRANINSCFAAAAISAGLTSAILDCTSPSMQLTLAIAKVLAGQDEFCMDYITFIREQEE